MFDVIYDPDKKIAALIDPDNGRALGPILAGDADVAGLLETFVGGIDRDPAGVHPADLERFFAGFVSALNESPAEPAGGLVPAGEDPAASIPSGSPPGAAAAGQPAPAGPAAPGEAGGVAGAPGGTEQAAPAGGQAVDLAESGKVADGGLPTGTEQAAPAGGQQADTPGAPSQPAGIPAAPAADQPGAGAPPQ